MHDETTPPAGLTDADKAAATRARTMHALAGTPAQAFDHRNIDYHGTFRSMLGAIGARFERRTWSPPAAVALPARDTGRNDQPDFGAPYSQRSADAPQPLRRSELSKFYPPDVTEDERSLWVLLVDIAEQLEVQLFV